MPLKSDFNNISAQTITGNVLSDFSGAISTKMSAKYMSGARVMLKINGRIAAFATAVSWNIKTEGKEIWTVDNYVPHEIVPNKISIDGTIGGLVIPGQGATQELIQPDVLGFLFHRYITIEVRDIKTDALLFYTGKAQITSRAEDVKSDSLASVRLSWKAIAWRDERDPVYPKGATGDNDANAGAGQSPVTRLVSRIRRLF